MNFEVPLSPSYLSILDLVGSVERRGEGKNEEKAWLRKMKKQEMRVSIVNYQSICSIWLDQIEPRHVSVDGFFSDIHDPFNKIK